MTPLMAAFYSADLVRLLLPHVKDVNAVSKDGFTALFLAALNGREEVVRILLEAGASPNPVNSRTRAGALLPRHCPPERRHGACAGGPPA
jgi:ankyrin repeat protein